MCIGVYPDDLTLINGKEIFTEGFDYFDLYNLLCIFYRSTIINA